MSCSSSLTAAIFWEKVFGYHNWLNIRITESNPSIRRLFHRWHCVIRVRIFQLCIALLPIKGAFSGQMISILRIQCGMSGKFYRVDIKEKLMNFQSKRESFKNLNFFSRNLDKTLPKKTGGFCLYAETANEDVRVTGKLGFFHRQSFKNPDF